MPKARRRRRSSARRRTSSTRYEPLPGTDGQVKRTSCKRHRSSHSTRRISRKSQRSIMIIPVIQRSRETHRKLPGLYGRTLASPGDYGSDGTRLRAPAVPAESAARGSPTSPPSKGRTEVPVIGIWKEGHEGVYITRRCVTRACVAAGTDLVAVNTLTARG